MSAAIVTMALKQPVTQVRLTNVAVVRLRIGGERFEAACYKNKVLNWRDGKETDLNEVLQVHAVFHNVSKGELAKKAELVKYFGTGDQMACLMKILDKGELQVSELERRQQLESLFNDIVSFVMELTYSAVTGLPLSRSAVSTALKSLGFAVRLQQPAKAQALHAALLLQQHNPGQIRRRLMRLKLQLPLASGDSVVASAAGLLHYIVKDCAGIIETQEPTLDALQRDATTPPETSSANEWLLVFLAPPGVYRELEEKAQDAGGSLSVVAWNCLHDTLQDHQQQQQEEEEDSNDDDTTREMAPALPVPNETFSPSSTEATRSSKGSSANEEEPVCCCCTAQCDEDDWGDTTTRAQRKSRGGKGKKQHRQQNLPHSAALTPDFDVVGAPCPLHVATCKHHPAKTEKRLDTQGSRTPQQHRKKQSQQQQKQPQEHHHHSPQYEDRLTQDALEWLSRDVHQQNTQHHQPEATDTASSLPQEQQQQQQQQRGVRCRVCDEMVRDVAELRLHSKGSRHATNVRRQADKLPPLTDAEWAEIQLDKHFLGGGSPSQVRGF